MKNNTIINTLAEDKDAGIIINYFQCALRVLISNIFPVANAKKIPILTNIEKVPVAKPLFLRGKHSLTILGLSTVMNPK